MTDWGHEWEYFEKIRSSRAERALLEDTVNHYHIDTCKVFDRDWNYETGIEHPSFRGGEWVVVRGYDTIEEAKAGHLMWCEKAKAGFQKLYDIFEEKIFCKEKYTPSIPKVSYYAKWTCIPCHASVERFGIATRKEAVSPPRCPFCGESMNVDFYSSEVK